MAVVKMKSTVFGVSGVGGYTPPNSAQRLGTEYRIAGTVANLATDNTGSEYALAEIPWSAILQAETAFRTDGWGFAQAVIGVDAATTGLLNAAKGASTTGQTPVVIFGAKWNQPLWQALGLAAAPVNGGFATLKAYAVANATGAGAMQFSIRFAHYLG